MDLTNIEKLVQDNIFEERYNGRIIHDTTITNLNIDDKYVTDLRSRKRVGKDFRIRVTLNIKDLPSN